MSDETSIESYVGRYQNSGLAHALLEVSIIDGALHIQTKAWYESAEAGGLPPGKLKRVDEHAFSGVDRAGYFEFKLSAGALLGLTVGEPDAAERYYYSRLEPFQPSSEPPTQDIVLGMMTLCMFADPADRCRNFYQRLGVESDSGLFFMDFLDKDEAHGVTGAPITFFGGDIREIAAELVRRGLQPQAALPGPAESLQELTELPTGGCGSFLIFDPDGNGIFFTTSPDGVTHSINKRPPKHEAANRRFAPGQLVLCFDVTDLEKSSAFYRDLGMQLIESTETSMTLTSEYVPYCYLIRLRQAKAPAQHISFVCEDPDAASESISARGIEVIESEYGPAVVDPEGRVLALLRD